MIVATGEELRARLASIATQVDAWLERAVDGLDLPANLDEAVRYALLGGGKRVRPGLAWLAAEAAGAKSGEVALPSGGAVELVHAFSLVHDDLPAMDDDDLRRGRPTLHVHAGEAMAILAGDLMLSAAYEMLARGADSGVGAVLCNELAIGTRGMIAGQVLDTLGEPGAERREPLEQLERIHRLKTGALIRAAMRMGAIAGLAKAEGGVPGEKHPVLVAITGYAESIGLMFQVVDDLLDVEQEASEVGKRTGKDEAAGKLTYPGLLGVEGARGRVRELLDASLGSLEGLGDRGVELADVARALASRKK